MPLTLNGLIPMFEVFDLPKSVAFYRDVLGFEMVSGDESFWCMLKSGVTTIMLNTAYEADERPPAPDAARVRGHGDASLYLSTPDPAAVYAQLSAKGWPATEPAVTGYGMREVKTKDPDGFPLSFICPVVES